MSHSTLQAIWPGEKHADIREFPNSWGTAPVIWSEFCVRYFGQKESHWAIVTPEKDKGEFWKLWKDQRIPASHRAVFMWTFDHAYIKKEDYGRFARDLHAFLSDMRVSANYVNHWPAIRQWFEMEHGGYPPAVSLWVTSVTSDPFLGPYNEEKDDYDPFDWSKAFDVYEELDKLAKEEIH